MRPARLICVFSVCVLLFVPWLQGDDSKKEGEAKNSTEAAAPSKPSKATVAQLTVKGSFPETAGQLGLFGELEINLRDFVARLDAAASDKSVSANRPGQGP
jgi:hypothetical protein